MIKTTHKSFVVIFAASLFCYSLDSFTVQAAELSNPAKPMSAKLASLQVNVTDINSAEGDILIGVFNSAENYASDTPIAEKIIQAKTGTVSTQFETLSAGTYAIKVLHDEDGDEEIDLSIIGAPSEDYGFSQNARDPFSQPEWEEAKFELTTSGYTATIEVK